MIESQHVEWKETWRDEYLRWICGFANAEGGVLVIGRRDDGEIVGVANASRLLTEIPNKVRDLLGIMVDVNLVESVDKSILEIRVDPYPVSYKGEYHYRSGSNKQELKRAALDRFLLRKVGKHWDGVPLPRLRIEDLSTRAVGVFRKLARQSQRLDTSTLKSPLPILVEKLHLMDGDYLKRAAALLFHRDPECFFTGAFVKIGFFRTNTDLLYHDEVHGDLFNQVEKTIDLLLTKYLRAGISYRGIYRFETFPVPEPALREAVVNAIVHKDYSSGTPIQIKVHDDQLSIWNTGELPLHWSTAKLKQDHPSKPFNPDLANAFFRAGIIEAWGRGIELILKTCREAGSPEPQLESDPTGLLVRFPFPFEHGPVQTPTGLAVKPGSDLAVKPAAGLAVKPGENPRISTDATAEPQGEMAVKTTPKVAVKSPTQGRVLPPPDQILKLLRANPDWTVTEVATQIGKSKRTTERLLALLTRKNRLRFAGPKRGGRWEVLESEGVEVDVG